jgi:two-component system, cell cycle sensor histidine kinase and response regulator CckA
MSGRAVTVLVVEDDDLFRAMTVKLLKREGRAVLDAPDTAHALTLRHDGPIDLLVTDLVMEAGDGLSLAQSLARRHPALKVLFMSGYGQAAMRAAALAAPNRTFIEKPFTPDTLERAVEELLAGPGNGR